MLLTDVLYRPIYRVILGTIHLYIDRYLILSTDVSTDVSADTWNNTRAVIERLSVGRVSTNVSTDISTDQPIHPVKVKYRCSIGEVSVNHQVYRSIHWSILDRFINLYLIKYRPILDRLWTDTRLSIDQCIGCGPP